MVTVFTSSEDEAPPETIKLVYCILYSNYFIHVEKRLQILRGEHILKYITCIVIATGK